MVVWKLRDVTGYTIIPSILPKQQPVSLIYNYQKQIKLGEPVVLSLKVLNANKVVVYAEDCDEYLWINKTTIVGCEVEMTAMALQKGWHDLGSFTVIADDQMVAVDTLIFEVI
jgi:hypothetical protein